MGTPAGTGTRDGIAELRAVVRNTSPAPEAMDAYLEKVHLHAYRITDADVEELKAAGIAEDTIFEQTVAAAISEGLYRLDAAAKVIDR
jgi:alkylhydroperoxidase family enzyme